MCVRRLKATLERLQRLTQLYVDSLLLVFSERAQSIGAALDLESERVQVTAGDNPLSLSHGDSGRCWLRLQLGFGRTWQVFSEAEIRASVVFQLSELVNTLLKASRIAIGGSEWDALVAGGASLWHLNMHYKWIRFMCQNPLRQQIHACRASKRKATGS